MCHTRWGRDYLREHGVYEIVRAAHEVEPVDKISEHIERLVNLLKSDEPPEKEPAKIQVESDDEDNRIEEV